MNKIATVAAAALLAGATTSAGAAPAVSGTQSIAKTDNAQLQSVRWYGRGGGWRGGHWRGGHGWGWGAAGLAAGLALTSPYWAGYGYGPYDDGYYGDDYAYDEGDGGDVSRCEATFRSFDPRSGTYMGYDGVRHRCPYL
jgi:hypothetical protein